jgi:ubiquinone/menaquinone biosynthesis C-methylase UbiE
MGRHGPGVRGLHASRAFYFGMRLAYDKVYGRQHMLHYPIYKNKDQDLMQGQINFTDHCICHLPAVADKRVLEVGCGNGVQALYVHTKYRPAYTFGVDINETHIAFAKTQKLKHGLQGIDFAVDDAQVLASIEDSAYDVVICTESAHHYPDKHAFLRQVKRVLRPGGHLLLADLLRRDGRDPNAIERRLSLCHWSQARYRRALAAAELMLVEEQDLNDLILPAFADARAWFNSPQEKGKLLSRLGMLFGEALIGVYKTQLEHSLHYELMLCTSD